MSRIGNKLTLLIAALLMCTASQAMAVLPVQPRLEPIAADVDHGVYSVQEQVVGVAPAASTDPYRAAGFDNFSLAAEYILTGISWSGIYAEAFPGAISDTDFYVEIYGDSSDAPDLGTGPVLTWLFEGGIVAGTGGPDLTVTANGDVSPSTATTVGGGPGFDYEATFAGTSLAAGDYWISIVADQLFDNADPIVDPEWQWHLGDGPGDGFQHVDYALDGPMAPLVESPGKDLAFSLSGTIVPEPAAGLMGFMAFIGLGMMRRRR